MSAPWPSWAANTSDMDPASWAPRELVGTPSTEPTLCSESVGQLSATAAGKRARDADDFGRELEMMEVCDRYVDLTVGQPVRKQRNTKRLRLASFSGLSSDAGSELGFPMSAASSAPLTPVDWPAPSHVSIATGLVYTPSMPRTPDGDDLDDSGNFAQDHNVRVDGDRRALAGQSVQYAQWQDGRAANPAVSEHHWDQRQLELELDGAALTAWHVYSTPNRILNDAYHVRHLRTSHAAASVASGSSMQSPMAASAWTARETGRDHRRTLSPDSHYSVMNALLAQLHQSRVGNHAPNWSTH
ncbi:hypothetical protein THASP1DRAFT_27035 [Thamnocephalis sphaerospora]|uniref:Uncharacterized protein n=1 Tax=Thamnocephalis sphaerospora TaxID=78915 RepID=A0A4P9XXS7_9FUNG|nr:hypothetical protein THASP1DRAFT_27035 [Thamnocephalis sphaerospora]|eukprot:RKP11198.1 hypothetical protein THASP1DRAFT_27035 [Thamnocephalis sphaerospora]